MQYAIASIIDHLEPLRSDNELIDLYLGHGGPTALETQCNMRNGTPMPNRPGWETDGDEVWCNIRIPRDADADPNWSPWLLNWPFDRYVECIGWSGWRWHDRKSILFIFDIDADDHADGLTPDQIKLLEDPNVEWIEVRRSKGGKGIHWYVWLSVPIDTANHIEHAHLGAFIRDELIAPAMGMTAAEIQKLIDKTGYIAWFWHRRAAPNGFDLLKRAKNPLPVEMIPDNWRDHEFLPDPPTSPKKGPTAQTERMKLLQKRLEDAGYIATWVTDINALRTHKRGLAAVQQFYPGEFGTISPGTDPGKANCWIREREDGVFDVYSWQDEPDWQSNTREGFSHTTFGAPSKFESVGEPKSDNARAFADAESLIDGIRKLTGVSHDVPELLCQGKREYELARKGSVYQGRITILKDDPDKLPGMIRSKSHWWWGSEVPDDSPPAPVKVEELERRIVYVKQENSSLGLYLNDGISPPFQMATEFAKAWIRASTGVRDAQPYIDKAVRDYCELTFDPFGDIIQEGGPGGKRLFNPAPQFAVKPVSGNCDDILSVFEHLGQGIDEDVKADPDCQRMGITSGADYLLNWVAGVIQRPSVRDVGLTLHGPKWSAKSTLIEIFAEIIEPRGIADAAPILRKGSQFTGPIATAVVGKLEEQDCSSLDISNQLCDWLTALRLIAEFKHRNPYWVKNCLHIIQTANDASYAPVFEGDSRFTVIECRPLSRVDPNFRQKIHQQAPAFLQHLLEFDLKPPCGRTALPPLENEAKREIQENNRTLEEQFAAECLKVEAGSTVSNDSIHQAYVNWCRQNSRQMDHTTAQSLTRNLSRWFTINNVTSGKSGGHRGRKGISLSA